MGPIDDMLIIAEWRSTSAASVNMGNGERVWCHLLNVVGTVGPGGRYAEVTIAIPLDAAEAIANNMKRVAHLTDEELDQNGRHIT
jgi:hypothetical protein